MLPKRHLVAIQSAQNGRSEADAEELVEIGSEGEPAEKEPDPGLAFASLRKVVGP